MMKKNIGLFITLFFLALGCNQEAEEISKKEASACCPENNAEIITCNNSSTCDSSYQDTNSKQKQSIAKVTFVELGSVNCIPCKQMQPVMKSIEQKYGKQVNVVFYDVWKPDQKIYAEKYGIKLIPTQIFLDESGKEFHRHEGFYPESEIDKILQNKGLSPERQKDL